MDALFAAKEEFPAGILRVYLGTPAWVFVDGEVVRAVTADTFGVTKEIFFDVPVAWFELIA